jgi:hypothetical protein
VIMCLMCLLCFLIMYLLVILFRLLIIVFMFIGNAMHLLRMGLLIMCLISLDKIPGPVLWVLKIHLVFHLKNVVCSTR